VVIDGGRRLEPELEARVETLDSAELRRSFPVDVDTLPLKPVYGSTFAYAPDEIDAHGFGAVPSLAVGGLSAVWGGAVLPYGDRDHDGWPFGRERLDSHYRAVFGFLPLAGEDDALAEAFPLYGDARPLRATRQVDSVLRDIRVHASTLRRAGVVGGRSRLAVRVEACEYLGVCLLGCPRRAIWSSDQTLGALVRAHLVDHRPGVVAERVEERSGTVRVVTRERDGTTEVLECGAVFVAAGALATTRIALASLEAFDRDVELLDSAYYTFPAVRWSGERIETGNTLAQAFIEIDDGRVSSRPVHLQIYGFNDLMLRAVAARAHLPERAARRVLAPLLRRLTFVQGYLHSDESPGAVVQLGRDGSLRVAGHTGSANACVERVVGKVRSLRRSLGIEPLTPMLRIWPPGKGFHVGGSFPMRETPGGLETDVHGRLPGFERVHLADASVFPTLPATTITLAVMANAHRIAAESVAV
jgi:choline dehydrogenase-like flavoprotein